MNVNIRNDHEIVSSLLFAIRFMFVIIFLKNRVSTWYNNPLGIDDWLLGIKNDVGEPIIMLWLSVKYQL